MALYRLVEFGSTEVPQYNAATNFGVGRTADPSIVTISGASFDPSLGERGLPVNTPITHFGQYDADTLASLQTQVIAMQQKVGMRDQLWRERVSDGALQWCWARLSDDPSQMVWQEVLEQTMRLPFIKKSPRWYSENPQNTTIALTGAQPKDIDLPNADTATGAVQTNVVVTITAGDAAITAFRLYDDYSEGVIDWQFTGTIAATKSVVIDTGAFSVTNDGTNAFANLVTHATDHRSAHWLYLLAGTHPLRVTWTGGGTGATINFTYYQAYV